MDYALSKNFNLSEALHSNTAIRKGINNRPSLEALIVFKSVCDLLLEPLRASLGGKSMSLSNGSWFRCLELNRAVGGSRTSEHMRGTAVDIPPQKHASAKQIFDAIRKSDIPFNQLIWERNKRGNEWVHCSVAVFGNAKYEVKKGVYDKARNKIVIKPYRGK